MSNTIKIRSDKRYVSTNSAVGCSTSAFISGISRNCNEFASRGIRGVKPAMAMRIVPAAPVPLAHSFSFFHHLLGLINRSNPLATDKSYLDVAGYSDNVL